ERRCRATVLSYTRGDIYYKCRRVCNYSIGRTGGVRSWVGVRGCVGRALSGSPRGPDKVRATGITQTSISRWLLDALDDEHVHRACRGVELDPELFAQCREEIRRVGIDRRRRGAGG